MVKIEYFVWIDTFFVYFCRKYAAPRLNISNEFDDLLSVCSIFAEKDWK